MDARSGPWLQTYPPGAYPSYPNFGSFQSTPPGGPYQEYQALPGAEMTQYPVSPTGAPFPGSQGPSAFFPSQPSMPPFGSMQQRLPAGLSSMRYYDQRVEARAPVLPKFDPGEIDGRQDQQTNGFDDLNGKSSEAPQESKARAPAGGAASADVQVAALCGLVAALTAVLAVLTAWNCYSVMSSGKFRVFDALASESRLSFFHVAMKVFIVLACIVLIAASSLGCLVAFKATPKRRLLQGLALVLGVFGCLLLLLALAVWLLGMSARPHAVGSANLICQDARAWDCLPDATVSGVAIRLLEEVAEPLESAGGPLRSLLRARRGGAAPSLGRRLGIADSAMGYISEFNETFNASAGGESPRCEAVRELCAPPTGFVATAACVCSGFWRKPSENDTATLKGPWNGTEGAYCAAWTPGEAPWCFVGQDHDCTGESRSVDVEGSRYMVSSAPCSHQADSRSQLVLDGYDELLWSLVPPALLGLVLLLLAGSVFGVARLQASKPKPAKKEEEDEKKEDAANGSKDDGSTTPPWDDKAKPLEARFERAQKEAVRTLRDDTPQDVKLLLYGFYEQAKFGDCRSERPGFFNKKQRAKWDAWAKLRGMSKQEAMEGYIMSVGLIE